MKKYVLISFFNGDATGVRVFSTREKLGIRQIVWMS